MKRSVLAVFLLWLRAALPSGSSLGWWIWADRAVKAIVSFLTVVLLARVLGGGEFGRWVLVWSVCAFALPLIALPPMSILVRECAVAGLEGRASILLAAFCARVPAMSLCALLLWGGGILLGASDAHLWLLGLAIVGIQSLDMFDSLFLATGQGRACLPVRWTVLVVGAALRLFAGWSGGGAEAVLQVHIAESALMTFVGILAMPEYALIIRSRLAVERFAGAGALILTDLLAVVVTRLDQLVIGAMLGNSELGRYGLASRFAEAWLVVPMVLVSSWMGDASRLRMGSGTGNWDEWMTERYRRAFAVSAFSVIAMAVASIVAATYLLGDEYGGVVPLVLVLSVGGIFAVFSTIRGIDLVTQGRTGYSLISLLIGAGASILMLWVFVPTFGLMGGAIAIAASQAVTFLLPCLLFKRLRVHLRYLGGVMSPVNSIACDTRTHK